MHDDVGGVQRGLKHVHGGDALVEFADDRAELFGVLRGEGGDGLGLAAGHTDEAGGVGADAAGEHIALQLAHHDVGLAALLRHGLAEDDGAAAAGGKQDGLSVVEIGDHQAGQRLMAGGQSRDEDHLCAGDGLFKVVGHFRDLGKAIGGKARQLEAAPCLDGLQILLAIALLLAQGHMVAQQGQLRGGAAAGATGAYNSNVFHNSNASFQKFIRRFGRVFNTGSCRFRTGRPHFRCSSGC